MKSERKKRFTYRDIKTVYTIIFFENSTQEFHQVKKHYIHKSKQVFDAGLQLKTLQEYVLISLDIFKENMHNKVIINELDAWLTIMAYDEPERIMEPAEIYPECRAVYEEIYDMCRNIAGVMRMYSKELAELDRNTVKYMIEDQEKVIKAQKEQLNQKDVQLNQQEAMLKELTEAIEMLKGTSKQ